MFGVRLRYNQGVIMAKKKATASKEPSISVTSVKELGIESPRRKYTVQVPEGHDLDIQILPVKDFLRIKALPMADTEPGLVTAVNELLTAMPDSAAVALGKQYARLRGIRGRVSVNEGYIVFASDKSLTVGLYDILKHLQANRIKIQNKNDNSKVVRKISKERKISVY
jgi:hypothetical protein